ncbi:MAG: VCBS repeat-containing protein, partial [Mucilaginibacter sp.]
LIKIAMKKTALMTTGIAGIILLIGFKINYSQPATGWHPVVQKINVEHKPFSVEVADLNGDKIKDIVIANGEDSSVTILTGMGKGIFSEAKGSTFLAGYTPNDIAIADFNKDGRPDLAFANHDRKYLTVLKGDGQGKFSPVPGSPFAVAVRPHTHGVAVADFNNDGNLDLLTDSWGDNHLAILFGNNTHGFSTVVKYLQVGKHPYQRARVGDLNKDGNTDIITTNLDGNNTTILLGDGKGNFNETAGSPFACGDSPFGVAVGDINRDGNLDLAVVNSPTITSSNTGRDGLTILLGDGKGGFKLMSGSPFATGKSPSRVAIGDLNGDGLADIAVANYNSDNISVFIMNAHGVAAAYTLQTGKYPDGIAIADLDGDGKGDIVVSNSGEYFINIVFSR